MDGSLACWAGGGITVGQANALRHFAEHAKAKAMSVKVCGKSVSSYLAWLAQLSKGLRKQPGDEKEWGVQLVLTEQHLNPTHGIPSERLFRMGYHHSNVLENAQGQSVLLRDLADILNNSQIYINVVELKGAPVFWADFGNVLLPGAWDTWWDGFKQARTHSHGEMGLNEGQGVEKWMSPERVWTSGQANRLTADSGRSWMERKLLQEKHLASPTQKCGTCRCTLRRLVPARHLSSRGEFETIRACPKRFQKTPNF